MFWWRNRVGEEVGFNIRDIIGVYLVVKNRMEE
jgi:hypothetical protein